MINPRFRILYRKVRSRVSEATGLDCPIPPLSRVTSYLARKLVTKPTSYTLATASSPLCGAADEEQVFPGALPREEESLTSVLRLGSA